MADASLTFEAIARFSLLVGLHEYDVTTLEWNSFNLQRLVAGIYIDQAKAGN